MATEFPRMSAPTVATESGAVRGAWQAHRSADGSISHHAVFRGVPYAAPPVDALRFAAPQRASRWDGVREAAHFGPTPQRISPYNPPRVPEPSIPGDETLNVNVTTPDPSGRASLPVLVWIHGGGFIGGSPASPWYVGEAFARDGVVTVTFGYRLGFEGFAWLADAGTGGVVNNRGVLDWLAALEWVQQNITAFGGDPARVTIGGQSAGGAAVMRLLSMPRAQGLFSGALAISPPDASATQESTAEATRRIAATVGAPPTGASASGIDENAFFAARGEADEPQRDGPRQIFKDPALALAPCVDGDVCPTSVSAALVAGVGADKPLLIGATAHEFTMMLLPQAEAFKAADPQALLEAAGASSDLARAFVAHSASTGDLDRGPAWVLGQAVSDVIFRAPVGHWSHVRTAAPGGTWTYDFRWESQSPDVVGAAHCVDLPFGMDVLAAEGVVAALGPEPPQALADAVHGDWLALIRDGQVAAPQHGRDRHTIIYGADGARLFGTAYELEARIWDETHPQA